MKKEIICTVCPRGCHIQVEGEGDQIRSVENYNCKRGLEYATAEFTHPVRILTTTVKLAGMQNEHAVLGCDGVKAKHHQNRTALLLFQISYQKASAYNIVRTASMYSVSPMSRI